MSDDGISLVLAGQELRNWTRYEVESDLLTPSDAFSVEVGRVTKDLVQKAAPGQLVALKVGTHTILNGRIDGVRLSFDAEGSRMAVEGRDRAADLVDCSADPGWDFHGLSLKKAAEKVLRHFGIAAPVSAVGGGLQAIPRMTAVAGESAWEFLERYARRQEVLMWFAPDGSFRIEPPDGTRSEIILRRGANGDSNVLSGSVEWGIAERYSRVTVLGQTTEFLGDSSRPSSSRTDAEMEALGLKRSLVLIDGEATSIASAGRRARWEIERRRAEGLKLEYEIRGHLQAGALVRPGLLARVVDVLAGIDDQYLITSCRWTRSSEGTRTRITVRRQGALLGLPDPPQLGKDLF